MHRTAKTALVRAPRNAQFQLRAVVVYVMFAGMVGDIRLPMACFARKLEIEGIVTHVLAFWGADVGK